ncbi:MAG: hypothetical protein ABIK73_07170 [candidate division WOR-3 bacterium]
MSLVNPNLSQKQRTRAKSGIDPYSILGLRKQVDRGWQLAVGKAKDNTIKS